MQFTPTHLPGFTIAGISVRTTNAGGQAQRDIGAPWQRFMQEDILHSITGRLNDDVYCVYTNYDGDFNAPYTTVIGCAVNTTGGVPEGLVHITIPAGTYRVYKPVDGLPENIVQTWMYIWQTDISRTYTADFDVYRADGSAETFVAVLNGEQWT